MTPPNMRHRSVHPVIVLVALVGGLAAGDLAAPRAQSGARVDFARDIRPLLTERCVGCHGPTQQQAGYRLDRRSGAFGGVVRHNINPGSGGSSRVYQRISGTYFGPQMPPTG